MDQRPSSPTHFVGHEQPLPGRARLLRPAPCRGPRAASRPGDRVPHRRASSTTTTGSTDAGCLSGRWNGCLHPADPDFPSASAGPTRIGRRRWDGGNEDVLIAQTYSPEDDERHLATLVHVWEDDRYLRIDGRPVTLIWHAKDHPDIRSLADRWRDGARRTGHPDLFLIRVESHGQSGDPAELGFDAACEFQPSSDVMMGSPPTYLPRTVRQRLCYDMYLPDRLRSQRSRRYHPRDRLRNYADVLHTWSKAMPVSYERYPCVTPSWDNSGSTTTRRSHSSRQHASSVRALGARGGHASPRTWSDHSSSSTHGTNGRKQRSSNQPRDGARLTSSLINEASRPLSGSALS